VIRLADGQLHGLLHVTGCLLLDQYTFNSGADRNDPENFHCRMAA
jgi:hypothetical protein